jgi:aspartate-semialdehyde dehydrogenase
VTAIAIVHPTDLLGKELRETLAGHPALARDVRLLSGREEEIGTLTEVAGAAALVTRYEAEALQGVDIAFFCGPIAANRPILAELPPETRAIVLSLDATVADGLPVVAGVNAEAAPGARVLLSPHPGAVLLAQLLHALRDFTPEAAVATLVLPASIRDDAGLEELFEQTKQIVAMTPRVAAPVFGTQLAFNLLPMPAAADPIAAQVGAVLGTPGTPGAMPPLALQTLQGGIFHSVSASLWVRCAGNPTPQAVRKALAAQPYLAAADKPRLLGPVDAAASDRILFGAPRKDEAAGGLWLWAVMDNLTRGGALNALGIAEAIA